MMERTLPTTGSEEIDLYMRTYYSLLRTTDEVQIQTLVETHQGMNSVLHIDAPGDALDVAAFVYCSLRLPACIRQVRLVVMGQSARVFARLGYSNVEDWRPVTAPGRRRRTFFDGAETLAAYVASVSDIDDLVPMLTALQIEWNKIHHRLRQSPLLADLEARLDAGQPVDRDSRTRLQQALDIEDEDLARLEAIWKESFLPLLVDVGRNRKRMAIRLLAGSRVEYRKATQAWWENILAHVSIDLSERPVYFISSNTHSVVNMLSGFALRREEELAGYLETCGDPALQAEYADIQAQQVPSSRENFLYYVLKKYVRTPQGHMAQAERKKEESQCGIQRVHSQHVFDLTTQLIELRSLRPDLLDPRLRIEGIGALTHSDAVILNVDYPLGMAAYHILAQVAASVDALRGVYVLGKAASLNGQIGDVIIPDVVHDEHSRNTYLFNNTFTATGVRSYLIYGTALDHQKSITVRGTFLQNRRYMDVFYREGYTDIEMEAGPYLSALYEVLRPRRHPTEEIVNLYSLPFDVGIIHYASDTPLSKGRNLGTQHLSYFGMDPTYAGTVAILRRILSLAVRDI